MLHPKMSCDLTPIHAEHAEVELDALRPKLLCDLKRIPRNTSACARHSSESCACFAVAAPNLVSLIPSMASPKKAKPLVRLRGFQARSPSFLST